MKVQKFDIYGQHEWKTNKYTKKIYPRITIMYEHDFKNKVMEFVYEKHEFEEFVQTCRLDVYMKG